MNSQREADIANTQRRRINELARLGRQVKETVSTDGWVNIGLPLLNKMIRGIIGTYRGGEWVSGAEATEYNKGYAQALMDFHNRFYAYVKNVKLSENALKVMDEEEKEQYKVPMIEEGSY